MQTTPSENENFLFNTLDSNLTADIEFEDSNYGHKFEVSEILSICLFHLCVFVIKRPFFIFFICAPKKKRIFYQILKL